MYLSKVMATLPLHVLCATSYCVIAYGMQGLRSGSTHVATHTLIGVLLTLISSEVMHFSVVACPSPDTAFMVTTIWAVINLFFSGFFIQQNQLALPWLGHLRYFSAVRLAFQGLLATELKGAAIACGTNSELRAKAFTFFMRMLSSDGDVNSALGITSGAPNDLNASLAVTMASLLQEMNSSTLQSLIRYLRSNPSSLQTLFALLGRGAYKAGSGNDPGNAAISSAGNTSGVNDQAMITRIIRSAAASQVMQAMQATPSGNAESCAMHGNAMLSAIGVSDEVWLNVGALFAYWLGLCALTVTAMMMKWPRRITRA